MREQRHLARDPLEWFSQEVGQTEPLHLPSPHVLQESVKCRLGRPSNLDGVVSSLDIADKPGVGIHHTLLSELQGEIESQTNTTNTPREADVVLGIKPDFLGKS